MNRRMYGRMDGNQYIYCLPPAGGRIRSQGNYYCLPPAGVLHSQNKVKMRRPRRRTRRGWRYGFININDMYNKMSVRKGGAQGCEAYEAK
jgi:hypothetical protein